MTHLENLKFYFPHILQGKILDLGSGRGKFVIDVVRNSGSIVGIEPNPDYISASILKAKEAGVVIDVRLGVAEDISFPSDHFDFVNLCEVIEHVESPDKLLSEVHRVLSPGGQAYLSIPNRFGFKDPHFHLYFINWLPRKWAHSVIGYLGKHKDYSGKAGRQSLLEMHYSTFRQIIKRAKDKGLEAKDMRVLKIRTKLPAGLSALALPLYYVLRTFHLDSFHIILTKPHK